MSSLRCPQCGLINFADAPACKRCKISFQAQDADAFTGRQASQDSHQQAQDEHQPYNVNYNNGVWRDGSLMVMTKETVLPNRCVKCNAPSMKLLKRTVEWYPRYIILVFLLIRIVGLILYFCMRKRVTVYIGLCEAHINRRRIGVSIGLAALLLGFGLFCNAIVTEMFELILPGLGMFLAGIVVMTLSWRVVTASKIQEPYVWVKGVDKEFLENLPPA